MDEDEQLVNKCELYRTSLKSLIDRVKISGKIEECVNEIFGQGHIREKSEDIERLADTPRKQDRCRVDRLADCFVRSKGMAM